MTQTSPTRLVADLEAHLRPREVEAARAWWDSYTDASPEADRRRTTADLALRDAYADPEAFASLCAARGEAGDDPVVARQVDVLHDAFVPHQVGGELRARIVELETSIESSFNAFRGEIDGRSVDDNAILTVLRTSDDTEERRGAWEASKQVGAEVAGRIRELARARNEAARDLGYRDHFGLALATNELDETRLFATLAEIDTATAAPFAHWKGGLDIHQAQRFGHEVGDLRPWHDDDPFFQEPAATGSIDLDGLFGRADLDALTMRTYDGIGLDVRPVFAGSDLLPRDGKSQHAFCVDIDREGDVRVLSNNVTNARWAETMLHEFGHAIYDTSIGESVPWLLRKPAHALTTEGVAMLFGRLTRDPEWLEVVMGISASEARSLEPHLAASRRAALLVFARWVLVMTHFERGLYADPDADHDTRWWDLVERFQLVRRPDGRCAPDWAAKVHLAAAPVYYQNYLYGELVASQLAATLARGAGGIVDRPAAGALLVDRFLAPGALRRWDRLVADATGESLTARHLAAELAA
ncbi:MAG TPA: M3 family metallopeptidase [Acidimicrobiia bacterium]|nr:M3 family metallopeptidase [Acidimicrobiia bacterium]